MVVILSRLAGEMKWLSLVASAVASIKEGVAGEDIKETESVL
jgi:hypothetical protein